MNSDENKRLLQHVFEGLAAGDSRGLIESMAEDFRWTVTGTTRWSGTYRGKQAVLDDLFGPLRGKIVDRVRTIPRRFIAEDDIVVVEAQGRNVTRSGAAYDNRYCFVFRVADGKLAEVTEYMDTDLVNAALGDRADA